MKLPLFLVIVLLFFLISGCTKDEETGDPNYPTIISRATSQELDQILIRLSESPLYECTSIDSFGYCVVSLKNTDCGKFDSVYVLYSKEEIVDMFRQAVFDYRDLLNISDTSGISVSSIVNAKGIGFDKFYETYPDSAPKDWIVTSGFQRIGGFDIPGTKIQMLISFDQVRSIGGKRYDQLYIPSADIYSEDSAKANITNVDLTDGSYTLKPTADTYWYPSTKVVFPIVKFERIELRLCWLLYPENWQVVVDTQTGEVLSSVNVDKI